MPLNAHLMLTTPVSHARGTHKNTETKVRMQSDHRRCAWLQVGKPTRSVDCSGTHCSPPEPGAAAQALQCCRRPLAAQGTWAFRGRGTRASAKAAAVLWRRCRGSGAPEGRDSGAAADRKPATNMRPLLAEVAPAHPPRAWRILANGTGASRTPCHRPRPSTPLATGLSPGPPSRSRCATCPRPRPRRRHRAPRALCGWVSTPRHDAARAAPPVRGQHSSIVFPPRL